MRNMPRLLATLIAAATLTAGMGSMMANAEDSMMTNTEDSMAALSDAAANAGIAGEVDALISEGQFSAEEASMLAQMLANTDDSEPFSYVSCDVMPNKMIYKYTGEMAQYGISFITNKQTNSCSLQFYLNKNIDTNDTLDAANYITPNNNVTLTQPTAVTGNNTANARCYRVYMSMTSPIPAYSTAFYYKLPKNLSMVDNVADLNKYTREQPGKEDNPYYSTSGNYSFKKIVFAKGDVNRDGIIDSTDSSQILKYATKLAQVDPNSPTKNYDEQAFFVAADYDENNKVNVMDAIAVNKLIMGTGT